MKRLHPWSARRHPPTPWHIPGYVSPRIQPFCLLTHPARPDPVQVLHSRPQKWASSWECGLGIATLLALSRCSGAQTARCRLGYAHLPTSSLPSSPSRPPHLVLLLAIITAEQRETHGFTFFFSLPLCNRTTRSDSAAENRPYEHQLLGSGSTSLFFASIVIAQLACFTLAPIRTS